MTKYTFNISKDSSRNFDKLSFRIGGFVFIDVLIAIPVLSLYTYVIANATLEGNYSWAALVILVGMHPAYLLSKAYKKIKNMADIITALKCCDFSVTVNKEYEKYTEPVCSEDIK